MCTRAPPDAVGICRKSTLHYLFLFYVLPRWMENQLPFLSSPYSHQTSNKNIHNYFSNNIIIPSSVSSCLPYSDTKFAWAQGALSADNAIPVGKWFCSSERIWGFSSWKSVLSGFMEELQQHSRDHKIPVLAWVRFHCSSAPSTPRIHTCPLPSQKKEKFWGLKLIILYLKEFFATKPSCPFKNCFKKTALLPFQRGRNTSTCS